MNDCKCGCGNQPACTPCTLCDSKRKPHKHAAAIKAWADGAKIQWRANDKYEWADLDGDEPIWFWTNEYRIKPAPVKMYGHAALNVNDVLFSAFSDNRGMHDNLKLTFEDGKLVDAEVINA